MTTTQPRIRLSQRNVQVGMTVECDGEQFLVEHVGTAGARIREINSPTAYTYDWLGVSYFWIVTR